MYDVLREWRMEKHFNLLSLICDLLFSLSSLDYMIHVIWFWQRLHVERLFQQSLEIIVKLIDVVVFDSLKCGAKLIDTFRLILVLGLSTRFLISLAYWTAFSPDEAFKSFRASRFFFITFDKPNTNCSLKLTMLKIILLITQWIIILRYQLIAGDHSKAFGDFRRHKFAEHLRAFIELLIIGEGRFASLEPCLQPWILLQR